MKRDKNDNAIWKKWLNVIISSIISGFIGLTIGYWWNGLIKIEPVMNELKKCMEQHCNAAQVAIDHITYNSNEGIICKVGINPTLDDHIVYVVADDKNNLKNGESIFLINHSEGGWSMNTIRLFVKIVPKEPTSNATFFINEKMIRRLGITRKNPEKKGIYDMYFKRENRDKDNNN